MPMAPTSGPGGTPVLAHRTPTPQELALAPVLGLSALGTQRAQGPGTQCLGMGMDTNGSGCQGQSTGRSCCGPTAAQDPSVLPRAAAHTCWILDQLSCTDSPFMAPVTARKQPRKHGAKPPCERGAPADAEELVVLGARLAMGSPYKTAVGLGPAQALGSQNRLETCHRDMAAATAPSHCPSPTQHPHPCHTNLVQDHLLHSHNFCIPRDEPIQDPVPVAHNRALRARG